MKVDGKNPRSCIIETTNAHDVTKARVSEMEYDDNYKYLRRQANGFGNDTKTVEALTAVTGNSYGRIIDIMRRLGDLDHRSFSCLYEQYILPVANYAAQYGASSIIQYPGCDKTV